MSSKDNAPNPYVSRGGLKLRHALDTFNIDPTGWACADLGASTGGFTDCLLQAGAARVTCIDTAYGVLAWKLRTDERVRVLERSNALHTDPPPGTEDRDEWCDLVVLDLGWTPQKLAIPAALRWLKPDGRIVSLIKPHYEHSAGTQDKRAVLTPDEAERVTRRVLEQLRAEAGVDVLGVTRSPIEGGGSRSRKAGNVEYLAHIHRAGVRMRG